MCANLILRHSSPEAGFSKLKTVYHILPAFQGRDPAGNMDGNNGGDSREYVSAGWTEGSNIGSEDDGIFTAVRVLLSKSSSGTFAMGYSAV